MPFGVGRSTTATARSRSCDGPTGSPGTAHSGRRCEGGLMDFSPEDQAFQDDLRAFLASIVTDEVISHDRETGDNFDEGMHCALGEEGYLAEYYKAEAEGGFNALRMRIFEL